MSTSKKPTFFTYPSVSATIFDVPEPKDISAKFQYNYFLPDERISTKTIASQASFIKHRRKNARQVNLEFVPLTAVIPNNAILSEISLSNSEKRRMLNRYKDKIINELEFLSPMTVAIKLQDATVSARLLADIEATLRQRNISTRALSPTETVLRYASATSDKIDGQAMMDSVNLDDNNEYISIDVATGKPIEVQKAGDVSKLTFATVFSQRFASDIANSAVKTPLSPAANIFEGSLTTLEDFQKQARMGSSTREVRSTDFVRTFDPVQKEKIGLDDVFLGGNTVMGYHVRKYNVDTPDEVKDIFITNTNAQKYEDKKVLYGATYNYSIAVVYLVRVFSFEKNGVVAADLLVESRESPSINVTCEEVVPPNAPDGLDFYLLQGKDLVVEWEFPLNPAEDIKRFQVFRRLSIFDPFEIFCEIDFDDSIEQSPRYENIPSYTNKKVVIPTTSVCDYSFTLDSKYIYAVCSVDAHDLSSGYSEQFEVSFDKFSAKLDVEFISEKNAPKPYPNFLLRSKLTEDAMRDSNHSSLTCYFDPEYLRIFDGNREEVDFLQTSEDEVSYKLQLMHLNFQQSVVANINIK